jgi:hypothetical protein
LYDLAGNQQRFAAKSDKTSVSKPLGDIVVNVPDQSGIHFINLTGKGFDFHILIGAEPFDGLDYYQCAVITESRLKQFAPPQNSHRQADYENNGFLFLHDFSPPHFYSNTVVIFVFRII